MRNRRQAGRPGLLPSFLKAAPVKAAAALHLDELSSEPVKLQQVVAIPGSYKLNKRGLQCQIEERLVDHFVQQPLGRSMSM